MNAAQQGKVKQCAMNFQGALDQVTLKQESELVDFFKQAGLKVYEPNKKAFREHVLNEYKNSKYSEQWPAGLLDKISAQ